MDPNPKNFPILSYVMSKLPTFRRAFSSAADFDVENPLETSPKPREPHFEITERMPHLNNCKLIDEMRRAVSDVVQARSTLSALGTRPDHEEVDAARLRLSEIDAHSSKDSEEIQEECKLFKAVISLDEMHAAYEKMLSEAERRLEKIYEAAVAGAEVIEEEEGENECGDAGKEEINEEVLAILKEAESGKAIERVELSKRRLRIFPEAFGTLKSLVVLRLSDNRLETIPDSIVGLENLEELNLSSNLLESLPDAIGFLFKLKVLDVSRNKLTTLPDSISQCRLLVELEASFNKLAYLPTHIGLEMRSLERLSISLNKIRSLPTSIGDMKSLRILDVHFNELHGLPNSIGNLTNLEVLNLSSNFNDLTKLPDTIANLTNLKELDVSNNQIHMLPDTFGGLSSLIKLNIDQNPLVVPPKEVVAQGVEAIKAYMDKRWAEILRDEDEKNMKVSQNEAQAGGLLSRSTSWLNNFVSNISGYLGAGAKSEADSYLNQQL